MCVCVLCVCVRCECICQHCQSCIPTAHLLPTSFSHDCQGTLEGVHCLCVFTYIGIHTVPAENIKHKSAPETVSGPDSLQMLTANYYQKEIKNGGESQRRRSREWRCTDRQRESGKRERVRESRAHYGGYTAYLRESSRGEEPDRFSC